MTNEYVEFNYENLFELFSPFVSFFLNLSRNSQKSMIIHNFALIGNINGARRTLKRDQIIYI